VAALAAVVAAGVVTEPDAATRRVVGSSRGSQV
jgi:hypothetical protein